MSIPRWLVGTWRLIGWERQLPNGNFEHPYGMKPVGLVIYSDDGFMSVQIMRSEDGRRPAKVSSQKARAFARDYTSYCGRFDVDEERAVITHHVEASLYTPWVGGDEPRRYQQVDSRLVLYPEIESDGSQSVLSWQKTGD